MRSPIHRQICQLFPQNFRRVLSAVCMAAVGMASASAQTFTFTAAKPCRVLDSRSPQGTPPFNGVTTVDVTASPCGLPASAQAFVFNATVVPPGPFGYLTMWPEGEPQPVVATLNALDAAITSNMAIVPTNNGSISVFGSNPTYLILDNFGYFAP
jgi:hypothetical protein